MKHYKEYSVEQFIMDDYFVRWVRFPDEKSNAFWSEFISDNPHKRTQIYEAVSFVKLFPNQETTTLLPHEASRLQAHISERIDLPVSASTVHRIVNSRLRTNRFYFYAAVISLTMVALATWWAVEVRRSVPEIQAETVGEEPSIKHLTEHVNPRGRRSRIRLADGSQVWLNADSKIRYSNDFLTGLTREVFLEGEAFFEVASDSTHPFIVHVEGVDIKVLGTSFNVKGYGDDPKIETTLVHGKISIAGPAADEDVLLAPNQRAVFLKERKDIVVEGYVETEPFTSWREGVLVFEDQAFHEIIPVLERTFNVAIHTDEAYSLDCRFTAHINNKSLTEVLELFSTSETIRYRIVGNEVFIEGSFCDD